MHQDATCYGGRPQPKGLSVRWGPSPPPPKREVEAGGRAIISAHGYCGRTAGWMKMALGMEVGFGPVDIVLDVDAAPLPKTGGRALQIFGPSLLWPNGLMHQDATWYGGRPRPTRHCLMWTQIPPEKGHTHPTQFLAHVYCGQMAGCMKMPLGTKVGLGPGHTVPDGVPAPAKGAQQPPIFGPCLLWPRSPISTTAELVI